MTVAEELADPTSSILAFFGSEVRRLRTKAGWSQAETAKRALASQAMISFVESAKRVPTAVLAGDLDAVFKTDGYLLRLHPLVLRYAYPSWFLPLVELEREACSIRMFESQVIPGLLQIEDYARAMLSAVRPDNLDDQVAARLSRQDLFGRETPPRLWFVLDEQVLRRSIGGTDVMRAQFEHLLKVGRHPRTVIQVIPERVTVHPGLAGPFRVMSFDEGPDVLHVDGFSQGRMSLDANELAEAAHAYDLLRAQALSPEASAELIGARLEGLSS